MMHGFARFLLFFAALWLPVQTMAGMVMPLGLMLQDQGSQVAATEQAAQAHPCHEAAAGQTDRADPGVQTGTHDSTCGNCEICHLACAGFMPSALPATNLVPSSPRYVQPALAAPASHIAEPPQHPPRSRA